MDWHKFSEKQRWFVYKRDGHSWSENVLLALTRSFVPYLVYEECLHGFRIKKKFSGKRRKSRILFFIDFPNR